MSKWADLSMRDVAGARGLVGGPFGSNLVSRDYVDSGVPVIRGQNLGANRFVSFSDCVYVTEEKVDRDLCGNMAEPGDLVFTQRGTLGQVAIMPETAPRSVISQSQMRLRVDPAKADPRFVYYWSASPGFQQAISDHAIVAGVPHINLGILGALPLSLPPRSTQRTIASALGTIDDLIENNRRRVEVLDEMARATYREWFVRFRYPGHEGVPLVNSALGPVPQGWGTPRLREHVSTQYGYTESASTTPVGPKYLRGMDINKTSFIDWSTVPFCPIDDVVAEKFRIRAGDVFVIRMADPGKVGICEADVDAVFASYLVRLRPLSELMRPYYLFFTLSDREYQGWVTGASTGATRKSVSAKVMTEPCVVLPPADLQLQFESAIGPIRAMMTTLVEKNAKLSALRALLLPKLVTGQIDVSTLDLDGLLEGSVA